MKNWEEVEKEKYSDLYKNGYPNSNVEHRVIEWGGMCKPELKVLDLGCGKAVLQDYFIDYTGIDISEVVAGKENCHQMSLSEVKDKIKDKFDLALSVDVLEHIPPNQVSQTLSDISMINADYFVFSISTRKSRILDREGGNLHLTVMDSSEWRVQLEKYFQIIAFCACSTCFYVKLVKK